MSSRRRRTPEEMLPPAPKVCRVCKVLKPVAGFGRDRLEADGLNTVCLACRRARERAAYRANPAPFLRTRKAYWVRLRAEALRVYGGDPPRCACCSESRPEFLAIDHIHGGGHRHRQAIKQHTAQWLKRNGWPPGFRVLCHNCNTALSCYGYCPHEKEKQSETLPERIG